MPKSEVANMRKKWLRWIVVVVTLFGRAFVAGEGGYRSYRIPALLVTSKGIVLAFCEGRKNGSSDTGDIDVLVKRSTDGGETWSPTQVV